MTTELVERVAEAICKAQTFVPAKVTAVHRKAAKAAIDALCDAIQSGERA